MPKEATILKFRPAGAPRRFYKAKGFRAATAEGEFEAAGTLCGHIDFATPKGTWTLSADEVVAIIAMLQGARTDVLENSEPLTDSRLYDMDD